MDDRQFDSFVKSLTSDGSRRGVLQILGAGSLAALVGRFAAEEDTEAKKKGKKKRKKKKCKGNTRKCNGKCIPQDDCCVDGDCNQNQTCNNGQCIDEVEPECQNDGDCAAGEACINGTCVPGNGACQVDGDCAANEVCDNGECLCDIPQKPCGDACCASDEACVDGVCVVGQGTCQEGEDICAGTPTSCNGNASCVCGLRFADGEPRCIQFVDAGRDSCTCAADFRCEEDFGPGTICITGGANCPNCTTNTLGRCARLCPGSV